MSERKPTLESAAKEAAGPVKVVWRLFGQPAATAVKEQYTTSKILVLFDKLATRFPKSKTIAAASEALKKKA